MRKASIKRGWKQNHLDKLETLGWSPSVKSNFANLQQLHSIVGNFKQSCSKMYYIEKLHSNFSTFRNVWWIVRVLFKFGWNQNHLGKFNNRNEIWANWDHFIQIWVKLKTFPQIGKIWLNSNRLNQLWTNNNSSIQLRAKWNIFIQFWVTSNSFIPIWIII